MPFVPCSTLQTYRFSDKNSTNCHPYLLAWRRLQDVSLAAGSGWAPPVPLSAHAPPPGAFLLGAVDISSASGLEPGSLQRALGTPAASTGNGTILGAG